MNQVLIVCEGYHDRAFWAGWLESLGCTDARKPRDGSVTPSSVSDAFGKVDRGAYAYDAPSSTTKIRIQPAKSDSQVVEVAITMLKLTSIGIKVHALLNRDADKDAPTTMSPRDWHIGVLSYAHSKEYKATAHIDDILIGDEGDGDILSFVTWQCIDPASEMLPPKQTLERLVCASLAAAYPERVGPVRAWLASRPAQPSPGPKQFAWSYMAGWYADHGCEDFFRQLWRDPKVKAELEKRLTEIGAWQLVQRAIND